MRWSAFFILMYVVLGVHIALRSFISWAGAAPDFALLAVVFIAINAPRDLALLGCFMLGAFQDLLSQGPLGLYAFSYGLVGMSLVGTQSVVYRSHPLTHLFLALAGGLITGAVMYLQGWVYPMLHSDAAGGLSLLSLLMAALYTALVAPLVIGPLQRVRWLFGFKPDRAPMPGLRR